MGRRTRFILTAHALTALSHLVPALALVHWAGPAGAAVPGALLWGGVAARLHRLGHDRPKPAWITRLVDEPVFVHWAACVFALVFWPITVVALLLLSSLPWHQAVLAAAAPAYGTGLLLAAWGTYVNRRRVRIHRVELSFANLPEAFDGYRITQVSDLHIGSYDRRKRGMSWARLANSLNADLTVVTGDLVTAGTAFYPDAAAVLGQLRSPDGVVASMGNHDQWNNDELTALLRENEIQVLKNEWVTILRGGQSLVVAGLDDAFTGKADLPATLAGRPAAFTVLLSHYPRFFKGARALGVDLTLSGHTHGGQLGIPWLADRWNVATWLGQRPRGTFGSAGAFLHVNAGLGTTGPPLRVGVRPEISLITLRRATEAC